MVQWYHEYLCHPGETRTELTIDQHFAWSGCWQTTRDNEVLYNNTNINAYTVAANQRQICADFVNGESSNHTVSMIIYDDVEEHLLYGGYFVLHLRIIYLTTKNE